MSYVIAQLRDKPGQCCGWSMRSGKNWLVIDQQGNTHRTVGRSVNADSQPQPTRAARAAMRQMRGEA